MATQSRVIDSGEAYTASVKGDWDTVRNFFDQEPTSPITFSGDTVLHVLVCRGHTSIFRNLLQGPSFPQGCLRTPNAKGNTALHEAARDGSVEMARAMVDKDPGLVLIRNLLGETPLYWAAAHGQRETLAFLVELNGRENGLRRNNGGTILHAAVIGGFYDLALDIVRWNPPLAFSRDENGVTALYLLAKLHHNAFRSGTIYTQKNPGSSWQMLAIGIYMCIPLNACEPLLEMGDNDDVENQRNTILTNHSVTLLQANSKSGKLRKLLKCEYQVPSFYNQGNIRLNQTTMNMVVPSQLHLMILSRTKGNASGFPWLRKIIDAKEKNYFAVELAKHLIKKEKEETEFRNYLSGGEDPTWYLGPLLNNNNVSHGNKIIEHPLLLATKLGIVEVVAPILDEFPEIIELLDQKDKNILHLSVEHRQVAIFDLLISKRFPISKMVSDVDKEGNTALHLAAMLGHHQSRNVCPAIQQMPSEVLWFKRVQHVSQPRSFPLQNSNGKTAEELFLDTHWDLLRETGKRTKDMMNVLIIISVLIATVNFTAVITVPGGYDSTGLPVLVNKRDFIQFMDYVSSALLYSLVTLGVSLSAYLSQFQLDDFYISLPLKFLIITTFFFYSIVNTVMAFAQVLILQINTETSRPQIVLATCGISFSCFVTSLICIDIMYPLFHHVIYVLFHSLSYRGQKM